MLESHPDISHLIQLAVAPVFLLTAVGTILGVLSNRLGRVVDRIRALKERLPQTASEQLALGEGELELLARRMRLVYTAMVLAVFCAIFVGFLIAMAFVDAFLNIDLWKTIGVLFIAAMVAFIGSLCVFLREIFLAVTSVHSPMR